MTSFLITFKTCTQLLLTLSCFLVSYHSNCLADGITVGSNSAMCIDQEREALLKFKQGIQVDLCGMLSAWGDHEHNQNCCQWHGIQCSNDTNHVVMINLPGIDTEYMQDSCLQGKLSSSLVELKHLSYLDLSLNYFQYQSIPRFLGALSNLQYLNFSLAGFAGEIPHQLGNLSRLKTLDLTSNFDYQRPLFNLYANNLSWLTHITFLSDISLSDVDLRKATDWLQTVNNLPFLRVLKLNHCGLPSSVPWTLPYENSSTTISVLSLAANALNSSVFQWLFNLSGTNIHLLYVDLSYNQLEGSLPSGFGKMHFLSHLDLSFNNLQGPIPNTISNMKPLTYLDLSSNNFQSLPLTFSNLCSLQELRLQRNNLTDELSNTIQTLVGCANKSLLSLDLSGNQMRGPIPDTIGLFSSLRELNFGGNKLHGRISQSLGQLSMLETLDLSSNSLEDTLSNKHFSNLSRLHSLDLSNNPALVLDIDTDWAPPFQLNSIALSYCRLGPLFPKWLLSQTNYFSLDVSGAGISGSIPESFWSSLPSNLLHLNLSHNHINGTLKDLKVQLLPLLVDAITEIDISFNNIEGAIPSFPRNLSVLLLNNNKFSNPVPFLCPEANINISNLDLSNNLLSGDLPDCWMKFPQLSILHLENNSFSGDIPPSISYLKQLEVLHLRNNNFSGELPRALENLTSLVILDLGYNSLSGKILQTLWGNLKSLSFLSLRSNKFVGALPLSLCQLPFLQILDLSTNHITETIPKCIYNLTAMQNGTNLMPELGYDYQQTKYQNSYHEYADAATVMWKRKEWSFKESLGLVKAIDISNNKLEGEIPIEISKLTGLVSLDLSRNNLIGSIKPEMGQLAALEILDLSNNYLSGKIPSNLANLNSLGILDLSNNHLLGKIPPIPQLQRFDASAYVGNPELCGLPHYQHVLGIV